MALIERAGQILRSFLSRDTETLFRAFTAYVRPLLEFCIFNIEYLTYKDRLSVLRLESLELRRLKAELIMCLKF